MIGGRIGLDLVASWSGEGLDSYRTLGFALLLVREAPSISTDRSFRFSSVVLCTWLHNV